MAKLNGFEVTQQMYNDATTLKRRGGKGYIVRGDAPEKGSYCANCNGAGYFHLQRVVGGPFAVVPVTTATNDKTIAATWLDDAWYQTQLYGYPCPVCKVT